MTLRLTIENVASLTSGDPVVKEVDGHGLVIGRAGHVDWTLPDPQAAISSVHCEIDFSDGQYWLTDRSTNGTFVNGSGTRLEAPWCMGDGDLISIGHYSVRVSVAGRGGGSGRAGAGAGAAVMAPAGGNVWGAALDATPDREVMTDAFGLPKRKAIFSSGDRPVEEAYRPPEAIIKQQDVFGLGGGGSAAFVPGLPPTAGFDAPPAPVAGDPFGLGGSSASPGAWPGATAAPAPSWTAAPAAPAPAASIWSGLTPDTIDFTPPPVGAVPVPVPGLTAEPVATPVSAPAAAPAAVPHAASGAAADSVLFARFLAGAGMKARDVEEVLPETVLAAAGEILRQTVDGLIRLLYARARLRNQFGVGAEVTTFQRAGNNPLKWTRSAEEALRQIVGRPDTGFLPGAQAVRGAFEDLQAHELALMAAMQEALKDTIERFSPAAIRARPGRTGLLGRLLPQARDAALWQAYETEYKALANETEAAYLDLFAKNFKKAYARNLARADQSAGG